MYVCFSVMEDGQTFARVLMVWTFTGAWRSVDSRLRIILDCIVYWSASAFWYVYLWYEYRRHSLCAINDSALDELLIAEQQISIPYLLPFKPLHIQTHQPTHKPGVYHLDPPPDIWRNGTFRLWTVRRHYFTISVASHSTLSKTFTSPQQATGLLTLSETHHNRWAV